MIQLPAASMSVAIAFNPTGLAINRPTPPGSKLTTGGSSGLYLSRAAYCGIFTGQITDWRDPRLAVDNNGVLLVTSPQPIKVIYRADSSGTTYLLFRHLQAVCDGSFAAGGYIWRGGVGKVVTWPATPPANPPPPTPGPGFTGVFGDIGVAATASETPYAIGYVGAGYTQQAVSPEFPAAPPAANLQNQSDINTNFTNPHAPTPAATAAAVAGFIPPTINDTVHWSAAIEGGTVSANGTTQIIPTSSVNRMRNPAGTNAYPIGGFTMLDLYTCNHVAETATLKGFVAWYTDAVASNPPALTIADSIARNRGFAPLPWSVRNAVQARANSGLPPCF